ncbi:MAG: helix-turn-helix transcriptional regulator [Arcobacter sp.]|jgi:AraC-like DNA-binding protein|uniref:helix-turn-helix transcriptional regulator n=2 Tax=Arcobacter TaxID=28196 RepID=UPI00022961B4|nr:MULTISPECIES: response regulator transcription factor [unclassified Arcobacter]MDY3199735.1 helix-turn-helix transcriptional regulator [Arcobacter sp.]BAK73540.1 AraC family transcriptional regulator [Arcobacter sp. L]
MKVVLPNFLEKNYKLNKLENLSICQYIQYEEQYKNEVFTSTNMLIFVIKGSKILNFKDEKIVVDSQDVLFLKSGNYVMSEILDGYYESILFMYDDVLLLDFIKKYNLNFDKKDIFDKNILKIKKTSKFDIFQSSVLEYLQTASINQEFIIKLKLEEAFLNILESDTKEEFKCFLSSIYENNYFKTKIEKEFEIDKNILLFAKEFQITDLAFRNKFKDTFGITPKKWQNKKRLEKAKLLLETTNYNVTEVCQTCGFDNISWFIQSFKKEYKITPKQIKNNKN